MTEHTPKGLILLIAGLTAAYVIARIQESSALRSAAAKWSAMNMRSRFGFLALLILIVAYAGSKPTNTTSQSSVSIPVISLSSAGMTTSTMSTAYPDTENAEYSQAYPTLSSNVMVLGYALTDVVTNSYDDCWVSLDGFSTNSIKTVADASLYGIHQETIHSTNLVAGYWEYCGRTVTDLFYSVSGMLSVNRPHGTPHISGEIPDLTGIEYLSLLQGPYSMLDSSNGLSRIIEISSSSNYIAHYENLYLDRDESQPTSMQLIVNDEQDITMNILFSSNTVANSHVLTNRFLSALQGCSGGEGLMGGESLRFVSSSNALPSSMTLRWTRIGYLDPALGETHDSDTLDSSYEVYISHTDPLNSDSDFDGLDDCAELALSSDPNNRDSDGDGLPDGAESAEGILIHSTLDADGDDLYDEWEVLCWGGTGIVTDASQDISTSGSSVLAEMLMGRNGAFSASVITTSRGDHRITYTDMTGFGCTNYSICVHSGGTTNFVCETNVNALALSGDYTGAEHTLDVTAYCTTNGGAKTAYTATQTFRQPSQPNLTVFKICDPLALQSPATNTVVLDRTFNINRVREWGAYYISADYESAAGWDLENLTLEISGDVTGLTTNASPAGDSLPLDVDSDATNITVTVRTTCSNSLALCRSPLYLIYWSPELTMTTNSNVFVTEEGHTLVLVSDLTGDDSGVGFTVNTEGRPSNTALTQDQIDALNEPFGGSDAVNITTGPDGVITGGSFISGDSGTVSLQGPAGEPGTSTSGGSDQSAPENPDDIGKLDALAITPCIGYYISPENDTGFCECDTHYGSSYPFDNSCLRMHWQYTLSYPEKQCFEGYEGIEVSLGSDPPAGVSVEINGEEGVIYLWEEEDDDWIPVKVSYGGTVIWQGRILKLDLYDRCQDYWGNGPATEITGDGKGGCGCDDGCENGDCGGNDGSDLSSVKFRVSLGSAGYDRNGGFIWFRTNAIPATVTPELFNVIAAPSANVTSNGTAVSCVDNVNPGGRRITLTSITGGVRLALDRYNENLSASFEGTWDVTKVGDSIKIVYRNSSSETLRSLSYSYAEDAEDHDRVWTESDNLTGAVRKLKEIDATELHLKTHMMEILNANGNRVGGRKYTYTTVGTGEAAVERVSESTEFNGLGGSTYYNYHEDNLNSRINGKLKTVYHADGKWEYHLWDEVGRETLRLISKEGSTAPTSVWASAADFDFDPAGNYADMNAEIILFDYIAHAGDSGSWHDGVKPRTETRYRIANGTPEMTSRNWYIYSRGTTNILGETCLTLTRETVRAASQSSLITDAANRTSIEVSFLDSYSGSLHLDGRPLCRKDEDGSVTSWEYAFDTDDNGDDVLCITTYSGTESQPYGITGRSTYAYEEMYTSNGLTSVRATLLNAAGNPVLSWEANTYDDKGRLISREYSDGTVMSNLWTCCALDRTIERDGTVREHFPDLTSPNWSASGVSSQGSLPGAGGYFTVTESNTDELGRETNSVRSVRNSAFVWNTSYAQQITTTDYPQHTSHLRVTTDHIGVVTTNKTYLSYDGASKTYYVVEETSRAGVKTTVKTPVNGEPETTTEWTDPVSGEELVKAEKSVTEIQDNGYEKRTAYVKYDDGEWLTQSETVRDLLGRTIYVETPLGTTSNFYNSTSGSLVKVTRTGMADTLYVYNELGEQVVTCLDVDGNGTVDYAGSDRINRIDRIYELRSNDWWQVTINEIWAETNLAACITSSISRVRMTGLGEDTFNGGILTAQSESEDWLGNVTTTSTYTEPDSVSSWTVTDTPDSNVDAVQKSVAGYPIQAVNATSVTNSFSYDGFARQTTAVDGRSNTTTTAYNDLGQVSYTQNSTNKTHYFYDSQGRRSSISNALGQISHTAYDPLNHTIATWGTSYPVAYQFDTAGHMVAMATTRSNAYACVNLTELVSSGSDLNDCNVQGLDITQWKYDEVTGLLTNKVYADGNGTVYSYTDSGRLATRTWARNITTTYSYDNLGQLTDVDYSIWSTPDVTYSHDRLGRILSAVSTASTNLFEYSGLALDSETQNGYVIDYTQDALGRGTGYSLFNPVDPVNPAQKIVYGFSNNGRFASVDSIHGAETNTFTYSYLSGTDLISGYSLSQGGIAASLTVTRSYESDRNLVTAITNKWNTYVISSFDYVNDVLGRRTKRTDYFNSLLSTNVFGYNDFSEVTEASMKNGTDSYNYDYDPIGNREWNQVNGSTNCYTANQLNQYTSITGGISASPTHDDDGNMTFSGSWYYSWDGENRMTVAEPYGATNGSLMVEVKYDYKNRRVEKNVKKLSGRTAGYPFDPSGAGTWNKIETRRYIWQDWNIIAELVSTNVSFFTPYHSSLYAWGLDLSGTRQGFGGVGGLLSDTMISSTGTNVSFSLFDVNGNITEYVDDAGMIKAHYEYDIAGDEVHSSGSMGDEFTHRFSTKPFDNETMQVVYQRRYYNPAFGRFISGDPIGISGGINIYVVGDNNVINSVDILGYEKSKRCCCAGKRFKYKNYCCVDNEKCKPKTCYINIYVSHSGTAVDKSVYDSEKKVNTVDRVGIVACMQTQSNATVPSDKFYPNDKRKNELLYWDWEKDGNEPGPLMKDQTDLEITAAKKESLSMCDIKTSRELCCNKVIIKLVYGDPEGSEFLKRYYGANIVSGLTLTS